MSLNNWGVIDETDFINQAEKDATPSNDINRVPKNESDGRLSPFFTRNGAVLNCGETINGGTLPVPVYQNKTDNELYACDGNDISKLKFIGFVTSNGTDGNPATFQVSGIVSGFTGLAEGEKYFLQDAVGTIGTTPGTYEVLVGVAISETQLLIQKGVCRASGSVALTATGNTTVTVGFRASKVHVYTTQGDQTFSFSNGGWTIHGGNRCVYAGVKTSSTEAGVTGIATDKSWKTVNGAGTIQQQGVIGNVTDTTFELQNTLTSGSTVNLFWEAEGEL